MDSKASWTVGYSPPLLATSAHNPPVVVDTRFEPVARKLMPIECERLQGFPDGWTDIPGASDADRNKALGNSMSVPVMRWIGEGLLAADLQASIAA